MFCRPTQPPLFSISKSRTISDVTDPKRLKYISLLKKLIENHILSKNNSNSKDREDSEFFNDIKCIAAKYATQFETALPSSSKKTSALTTIPKSFYDFVLQRTQGIGTQKAIGPYCLKSDSIIDALLIQLSNTLNDQTKKKLAAEHRNPLLRFLQDYKLPTPSTTSQRKILNKELNSRASEPNFSHNNTVWRLRRCYSAPAMLPNQPQATNKNNYSN